jgi:hypothetical protein
MGTSSSQIDSLQTISPLIACKGFTKAMRLAEVRYRKGLVSYLDVLDAQRTGAGSRDPTGLHRTHSLDRYGQPL